MNDWNAADAEQKLNKPGLLARLVGTSVKASTRRALKEASAVRVTAADEPRLENIVAGLAEKLGLGPADIYVIEGPGPNAIAGRLDRPVVAVTRELLDAYARTEIEAVVAHCLVRHREVGRRGHVIGYADDVRAVALTRYPPALASAIDKASPYSGRYASFYLVAEGATHRPNPERIEALNDL